MPGYDIAIIGAGPGGYIAAIRAADLGAKVALIERDEVGGVCLGSGCIPTKALVASAETLRACQTAGEFGVILPAGGIRLDFGKIQRRKEDVISKLREGIHQLLKGRGIDLIKGTAAFDTSAGIAVDGRGIQAKNALIATGSTWIDLPSLKADGRRVVTSSEALNWNEMPSRLVIVGGGVIGCEFACMMQQFGAKVTIVEATPSILPPIEKSISRLLSRAMKAAGIEILTSTTVESSKTLGGGIRLGLSSGSNLTADRVIVAVGRRANVSMLDLKGAAIETDERGFIKVGADLRTSARGVYAIGDAIGGRMLAHAASHQGMAVADSIFGRGGKYNPSYTPSPIFTMPEVASVGLTTDELKGRGIEFRAGRFPYLASGKAWCDGDTEGQAIVLADAKGKILGVHIIGHGAVNLIGEAVLAMQHGLTARRLAETIRSHPTLTEVVGEAAADTFGMAIHKGRA